MRSPTGVWKSVMWATISSTNDNQIIRFRLAEDAAEEVDVHVGDPRQVPGCAVLAVDVDEEVPGDAEREEVDREAADDLVSAQIDST